jgi:hypothetical protein
MEDEHGDGFAWEDDGKHDAQKENDGMEEDDNTDADDHDTKEADEVDESSEFAFVAKITEGHGEKLCEYCLCFDMHHA